jgi:hypothetical protein
VCFFGQHLNRRTFRRLRLQHLRNCASPEPVVPLITINWGVMNYFPERTVLLRVC